VSDPVPVTISAAPNPLGGLFAEADRQLTICNACRYCEGYCAVFPALERRRELTEGDITHLADLCHDCRACYTACMYAPPHEFAINPPAILSAVRRQGYDAYLPAAPWQRTRWPAGRGWPTAGGRPTSRRGAITVAATAAVALLALLIIGVGGVGVDGGTIGPGTGSPYRVLAYPALLLAVGLPAVWSVGVMAWSARAYWRATHGHGLTRPAVVLAALGQAATLRNLRGGGADCSYPGDEPSGARRRLHALVAWGFVACAGSTVAAAVSQDIAGNPPPYPVLSAPVLLGIAGGAGLVVGCAGLLLLRHQAARPAEASRPDPADPPREDPALASRGYALLAGLLTLAVTGLLTLVLRGTAAFAPVLVVHLAAVVACFAIAPYTKFMHVIYRLLALVHDNAEAVGPNRAGRSPSGRL
jgi:citrate/tricarballylate utilization protein